MFDTAHKVKRKRIEPKNIIKLYASIISEAYQKYDKTPELVNIMSNAIISPEDVFIYGVKEVGGNNYNPFLGKYIMKSITDFNTSLSDTGIGSAGLAMNQNEWITTKGSLTFIPSQLLIAYDNNGQVINAGDYKFDSQTLLKFNALLNIEPRRDFDHVFIRGCVNYVKNVLCYTKLKK